jgi:hypothetical protein
METTDMGWYENESPVGGRRRSIWIPDELWGELLIVAGQRGHKEHQAVSVSELVRRGARREIIAHYQADWYRKPPHLRAVLRAVRDGARDKIEALRKHAPNL